MAASLAPTITMYRVIGGVEQAGPITGYDFSTVTVGDTTISTDSIILRFKNESTATDAINPIVYLGGADASVISDGQWCQMKVIHDNSVDIVDEFETVTDDPTTTKELHVDIEAGTYIDVETFLQMPLGTEAGQYDWKLALKYEYTI